MIAFIVGACTTSKTKEYTLDWESLKTHKTPEWFTDAKFGIYFHWGVYSVPAYKTEWYPHYMYLENYEKWGGDVRPHHIEKYGEDFQYHDFIPQFTAEHFDADEWADLFKAAGAQYAGPVAEHSDGFSIRITSYNVCYTKLLRATYLSLFRESKNEEYKKQSVSSLQVALGNWQDYAKILDKQYHKMRVGIHRDFDWHKLENDVRHDIEIARKAE